VVDDERVHATDLGSPPVLPLPQFPANGTLLLAGLNASFGQGVAEPVLRASWFPTAGAFYYRAEVSYDEGNSWIEVYQGTSAAFEKVVTLGALTLRVQAVGQFPGPFSDVSVAAPTIEIMANSVAYNSLVDGLKHQVTTLLDDKFSDHAKRIAQLGTLVSEALSRTSIDKKLVRSDIVASSDRASASISQVQTIAVDAQSAVAALETEVSAEFDVVSASITENATAIATIDGYAASQWSVLTDVTGLSPGLSCSTRAPRKPVSMSLPMPSGFAGPVCRAATMSRCSQSPTSTAPRSWRCAATCWSTGRSLRGWCRPALSRR
jgi:hypothetical protein